MFSRLIVALGVSALMAAGLNNLDMGKLKDAAQDKFDRVELSVLDSALVAYHSTHNSTLPASLNADVLKQMDVSGIDLSKFSYKKLTNNKFELAFVPNGNTEGIKSFHSGFDLGRAYAYNFELGENQSVGTTDGDETDVDVSKKSVFIGDDVMIHGSVKIGDGKYGDGIHTFTHNYTIGGNANVNSDQVNIADNTEIGENANIRNYVEIIGEDISIGDRVTLWSEAIVGDGVTIANADKGELTFQTAIPKGTTIRRTGDGAGNITFYSGSTIKGGNNEIYSESNGGINIYTKLPKDTTIRRTGKGNGMLTYNLAATIGGSHTIRNDSNGTIDISGALAEGTNVTRGGYGTGTVYLNELSRVSGNVEINNDTKAEIYILNRLKDGNKISYSGSDPGKLYIRTNARFDGSADFQNEKGEIYFEGYAADGTVVKRTGSGKGTLNLGATTSLSGTSEFYNESSDGIKLGCLEIPDGYRIENVRKRGGIDLNSSVTLVPGTRIRVEGTDENASRLFSWDSPITIGNFLVRFSGSGQGIIDLCKGDGNTVFGGIFTARILGNHHLNIYASNNNWREDQFIEHNLYTSKVNIEKYNNLHTINFKKLYLEGCHGLELYGNFADNTKIIADGSDNGYVFLQGNYDGTIKFHGIVKAFGYLYSRNDLHDGTEITYNCPNDGSIVLNKDCKVERSVTINKLSKYNLYIYGNLGDGATINVREDYPSHLSITTDIPAGATVNY